ncbi:putative leucine-rich repeat-containing protein DDB_G0290503 [Colletes gigas]|uniref:putative leucine-rich repeat-containing protein DDB_G0290503 n=1 Tax=Colletes gigas TaxID=935657 RepID=UPI001C9A4D06|nr:putative leucine-rich repeat-containing protein DDB_G0290503 [Colletes gigas]
MEQEEDLREAGLASCNATPKKSQRTPRDSGSNRREKNSRSQEHRSRIHYTPDNSPDKYKTLQNSGSFIRGAKLQPETASSKRKAQSSHDENQDKIQRTCPSGKFVNALIGQWSKHMGVQTPLSQTVGENPVMEEMKWKHAMEERKIQMLQKKLQTAEETISSLSASRDAELQTKEEILRQIDSDWESITKYYYQISESLKEFQQHKDNLSALYNNVILMQQSTVKTLQQALSNVKLKDEEQRNLVAAAESKIVNQEKRIQEMTIMEAELKKKFEDVKYQAISEKNRLNSVHMEEKLELTKKQENLTSANKELQLQLNTIIKEKENVTNLFEEKNKEFSKLQEEIFTCKNKIENLVCQNAELNVKYERTVIEDAELTKQLESKEQEIGRLRENLNTRQQIESSLANDLEMIGDKYKKMLNDFETMENKLKGTEVRNSDLEKSLQEMKNINEYKQTELNKRIESLEKEKEKILSEKRKKIQNLENSRKLLEEKYEIEVTTLKKDFDAKLSEMKKTIATKNSAFIELNDTLNKMKEQNQNKRMKHDEVKENQSSAKRTTQTNINEIYETEEQEFQSEAIVGTSKITHQDKDETSNQKQQDIYNFNVAEINRKVDKINQEREDKNVTSQKNKIFKTRNTGFRQYGSSRKGK